MQLPLFALLEAFFVNPWQKPTAKQGGRAADEWMAGGKSFGLKGTTTLNNRLSMDAVFLPGLHRSF